MDQFLLQKLLQPIEALQAESKVKLEVYPHEELYRHLARSIADEIKEHNAKGEPTRLILPVGPKPHYPLLAEIINKERISCRNLYTFNMDEYLDWQGRPVPVDHPLSFRGFMDKNFFRLLDPELRLPDEHIFFPDPRNLDRLAEAIEAVGGIDTCYGGIGIHGHIAFNEPPISRYYRVTLEEFRHSTTRILPLAPETITMNASRSAGGNFLDFPPMAVTIGMKEILAARRIRLYADGGEWQRFAVRMALAGPVCIEYPVTLLQEHPDAAIITDTETAKAPVMHP
ncbi:hypothetical protein SDD30_12855 [Moorella naiadis]|uniref:glucosamine-6-phosphate isomerase n=1 Tax=Moorella naiadis (nom. illeg.) TaxID=3093670 RepID=UPI003D9CA214